ncbi:SAM-dependent methyltransferase [Microbispora bryophytorum]
MTETGRVPQGVDPRVPSVARIYDYFLGGKDNFASDREAADRVIRLGREQGYDIPALARANRAFLVRVIRELTDAGVRQFLDIGTGLPTQQNVHQVATTFGPRSRTVYVDNDPTVLVHARAILADTPDTVVVEGDLQRPGEILADERVRAHLDFDRPVAILALAVLHFFTDDAEVSRIISDLRDGLPSGGYLAISHTYVRRSDQNNVEQAQSVYGKTSAGGFVHRGPGELAAMLNGMEILEPGVVPVELWRPRHDQYPGDPGNSGYIGVLARRP